MTAWRVVDLLGARGIAAILGLGAAGALLLGAHRRRLFRLLPATWSEIVRHDPSGVLVADREGRLVHANPAARAWLGLGRDAVGAPLPALLAARLRTGDAEAAPLAEAELEALLAGAPEPPQGHLFRLGEDPAGARWVRLQVTRIPRRRGGASALCVRLRDVTEAWREREERRASEERYRSLVANAPLGVLACDREGRIFAVNDRLVKILGVPSLDSSQGADVFAMPALREAGIAELFARCLARGEPQVEEIALYVPALGGRIEARFHVDVARDAAGRVIGVQSLVEDLRTERRLEAVGAATGGLAHDFRNLLGTILLHAELLEADAESPAQRERIERLRQAGCHARELLERLLDPDAQASLGAPAEADLAQVVLDVTQLLAGGLPPRVELDLDLAPGLPPVAVPPGPLRQVVLNLMRNAAEAMTEGGGTLSVRATLRQVAPGELARTVLPSELSGPAVELRVADEGPGLDADVAELFAPFFSTRAGGTGLGLVTVAHVARAHGAAVRVETAPGRGTGFSLFLPLAPRAARPPPPASL